MRYVIYSAIKKSRLVYDTLYSIMTMSYFNNLENTRIVIYTNQLSRFYDEFEKYKFDFITNIVFEEVEDNEVEQWIQNGYIYNIKIQILNSFMNKFKANGLFIDSDMFIKDNIDKLFELIDNGNFIMYKCYGKLDTFSFDIKFLEIINILSIRYKQYFDSNKLYYQSGIIGINYKFIDILKTVQRLCDGMFKYTKLTVSEELAFSLVMQNEVLKCKNNIFEADRFISTYSDDTYRLFTALAFKAFLHEDEKHLIHFLSCFNLDINNVDICYENVVTDMYEYLRKNYGISRV